MYHYDKQTKVIDVLVKETCDRCGTEIRHETFRTNHLEIERLEGKHYPEGDFRTEHTARVCGACAPAVMEAIEACGVTFTTRER